MDAMPAPETPSSKEKSRLVNRLRRIRGQIEAIERALEADDSSTQLLQQATACRGALDGFIAEVIEDHILERVVDPDRRDTPQGRAADELIEIVHSYLT
jgi:DNA-binding FrmR family transcriptional regulator